MKATLYRNDGKIEREIDCDRVIPMQNGWTQFLRGDVCILWDTGPYSFVTNSGHEDQQWRVDKEIEENADTWDISLRIGDTLREWKGARAWSLTGKMITFWHGEWWDVVGQVIVEKSKK
jgi:hypothetical protein